ncbi:tryptophan synthase subunit alpha [Metallumcola ferriviriculae]|uniref:Tryptophan synthase alpha chain n=1 Tax=Metallumcola ferriviriculae TaxID=3039180 RepID=A0AAU0UJ20_9FIRM|nr:tryptophan synthase subunit alpha [Desulfitibacteraceae bacterium MK1]
MSSIMEHSRLETALDGARRRDRRVFMPFITAGDPHLDRTEELVAAMRRGGADIIELGVPFSDPLADGPVIQRASSRALKNGTTMRQILDLAGRMRGNGTLGATPLVLLLYYNTVYVYGEERFARDAAAAGVDGVVIPDLPLEAGGSLRSMCNKTGLTMIAIVTPTTSVDRIKMITDNAEGFIYYTAVTGVTGIREGLRQELMGEIKQLKQLTNLPVLLGFGISNSQQARQAAAFADGIIMGSALVELIENSLGSEMPKLIERFVREIKQVI